MLPASLRVGIARPNLNREELIIEGSWDRKCEYLDVFELKGVGRT